jgi:hypothetical protein
MVAKLLSSDITELEAKLNDWLRQNPGIQIKGMTPVSSAEKWVCLLIVYQPSVG